jgi:glycosyltransferase involved in cell wall biosynthesis
MMDIQAWFGNLNFKIGRKMENLPLVTFGIVNCNRLFYLKSCLESLLFCTEDYPNKEIIVVDNASIEEGTEEYLLEKEKQGIRVFRQKKRDPENEFAISLNLICREAKGDFICPIQGDQQFTLKGGWLKEYVKFYSENMNNIGCMSFDAQRTVTNERTMFSSAYGDGDFKFVFDFKRYPISGAGDAMFSKKIIDMIYPWEERNKAFEGGSDSETKMLQKTIKMIKENNLKFACAMPILPVSIAIYTDPRGTNARIRGNKRYGKYWESKDDFRYYKIFNYEDLIYKTNRRTRPLGIEDIVEAAGNWTLPIDESGRWKKNPIRPETAKSDEYIVIG